jgi:hypothetical protein
MIGDSVTVDQLLDEKVVYQQALRLLSRSIYGPSYISIDDLDALAKCFETLSEPVRTGFLANAHRDLQLAAALAGEIRPSGSCTTGDCDGESAWYVVIEDTGEHPADGSSRYCPGCAESFFNAGMTVRRIPPGEAADA